MDDVKSTYLRALILLDDITNYHNALIDEIDWNKKFRLFKNCFVALDIFRDSFDNFSLFVSDNQELINLGRDLKKKLKFIIHLRNKISGHLDQKLLQKAAEWEPYIFAVEIRSKKEAQILLIYKTLLESGINSFIDNDSNQKVFETEIDLFYPPNQKLFFDYIGELNMKSIYYLEIIIDILENKIEFWTNDKILEMANKAGMTDFSLKNAQ
jgi:hypothetical protein